LLFTSAYSQSERDYLADAALGLIGNSAKLSLFRSPFGRGARSERIFFQEFLTVRQELKRFERKTLGYSESLEMHKLAVALIFGVFNFVRKHHTLGTTPAIAAGLEEKAWSLERVVEMNR
jgi:hypothetical protein